MIPSHNIEITRQFSQSLLTKIFMMILRIIRNAILARVLGPADRGLFSLINSIPELVMVAGNCGLANAAAYQLANRQDNRKFLLANINVTLLLLGFVLLFASILVVSQDWITKDQTEKILEYKWSIAAASVLLLIKIVNINLLNILNRIRSVNLFLLLESLLPLVLFLLLWYFFQIETLLAAVYSWIASLFILAFCSSLRLEHGFKLRFDLNTQRQLFSFGSRGYFDTLFFKLLLRIDFIFISAMINSEALGYYAMATAAAELLLIVPTSLAIPMFSFFFKKGDKSKDVTTATVLRLLLATMIALAMCYVLFGNILIMLLFGNAYLPAYEPLLLLLPGIVALSYSTPIRLTLLGNNQPGTVSLVSGMALCLNIVLNFLLLPAFGINGVAVASSSAYIFGGIGLCCVYKKLSGLPFKEILVLRTSDLRLLLVEFKSHFRFSQS